MTDPRSPKSRPIDPLEMAKVVPPRASEEPAPQAEAPAPPEPTGPPPEPVPSAPAAARYRVLEDRQVSLGSGMAWMRKGKVVSDTMHAGLVALLREYGVPLEELPPER